MRPYPVSNKLYRVLLIFISISIVVFAFIAAAEGADSLTQAEYSDPVERYGHFAPGRPHEYSRLTAMSEAGRSHSLWLPENEVFEDVEPRLIRMTANGPRQILAIVSARDSGARLALIGLDGRLRLLVPDAARRSLRIIAFVANRLFETGHCDLQAPLIGAVRPIAPARVSAELSPGQQIIDLTHCLNP